MNDFTNRGLDFLQANSARTDTAILPNRSLPLDSLGAGMGKPDPAQLEQGKDGNAPSDVMARFTLRRLFQGRNMHGDSFTIAARSDGRFTWSCCAHDCKWTEAGSERTEAAAQQAGEAVFRARNLADVA